MGDGFKLVTVSAISRPILKACSLVLPFKYLDWGSKFERWSERYNPQENTVGISINHLSKVRGQASRYPIPFTLPVHPIFWYYLSDQ